jgi:hypothetical protein
MVVREPVEPQLSLLSDASFDQNRGHPFGNATRLFLPSLPGHGHRYRSTAEILYRLLQMILSTARQATFSDTSWLRAR